MSCVSPRAHVAVALTALTAAVVLANGCSRPKPPPEDPRPTSAAPASADASTVDAPAPPSLAFTDAGASTTSDPPAPPTALRARPETPFAVHLSWDSTGRDVAGFELQVKVNEVFVRAVLVDSTMREVIHHLRLPGEPLTYRVHAFNAAGASPPSPVVTITLPERMDSTSAKPAAMGPCIAPVKRAPKSSGCDPEILTLDGGTGHVVSNVPGAGNGCMRHLVGEYGGCTRELGVFALQADVVVVKGHSDEGFPLLHAIAGAGQYVGASIQTLRFSHGRYTVADEAHTCGESPAPDSAGGPTAGVVTDDLSGCKPPFATCQRDPTAL